MGKWFAMNTKCELLYNKLQNGKWMLYIMHFYTEIVHKTLDTRHLFIFEQISKLVLHKLQTLS